MKIRNEWIYEWVSTVLVSFLFFSSIQVNGFSRSVSGAEKYSSQAWLPGRQISFSGWVGLLEKFHFNWKMDSFTSWHGFLGQHSTITWLPTDWGDCSGKRAASDWRTLGHLRTNSYQFSSSSDTHPSSPTILTLKPYSSIALKGRCSYAFCGAYLEICGLTCSLCKS